MIAPHLPPPKTLGHISGFLIEPVAGRVCLISPELSSDQWPDGYAVFGEERFAHTGEFAGVLDRLVARHMGLEPPERLAWGQRQCAARGALRRWRAA